MSKTQTPKAPKASERQGPFGFRWLWALTIGRSPRSPVESDCNEEANLVGDEDLPEIFRGYKVGGNDETGQKIHEILHASQYHVVYTAEVLEFKPRSIWEDLRQIFWKENTKLRVRWACGDEVEPETIAAFENSIAEIRALRADLPGSSRTADFNLARAVNLAMLGSSDLAEEAFEGEKRRSIKLRELHGRVRYLVAAALPVALLVSVSLWFARFGEPLFADRIKSLLYVTTAGALAGFFSIVVRIRKLEIDIDQSYRTHLFYGLVRVTVAGIASVSAYVLMKAGLLFGDIVRTGNSAEILSVALVAGFSEALVPNLLQRTASGEVEKGTVADEEKLRTRGPRL